MRSNDARCEVEHFVPGDPRFASVATVRRKGRCHARRSLRVVLGVGILALTAHATATDALWPAYGADQGGTRYSTAAQINESAIDELRVEWIYHTGDMLRRDAALMKRIKFEVTPILVDDKLIACTPYNEIIALAPASGQELWRFDPNVPTDRRPANRYNCCGVAQWHDPSATAQTPCAPRMLMG